jgi:phosphonate transport system permease protein
MKGIRSADGRLPPRFRRTSPFAFIVLVGTLAFLIHGVWASGFTPDRLSGGLGNLLRFLSQAVPPATGRLPNVAAAALETFEMALVGTAIGAVLSLPLALLAAKNTSPHTVVYGATRGVVSFLRAVPDLVWGLIFIVAVGLGPPAGILAIAVDVTGFCGRFYAERIEELDPGPSEALRATGATPYAVIAGSVVPAAFPSFVATTLFALESATRSAVVLGLVGAGGIGIELTASMELFRFDEAFTIVLVIFAVVVAVERISAAIRRRMM